MSVTPETLLQHLPPFRNERVLVKDDQKVNDIIAQILKAHEKYAHYYSSIAKYFDADTTEKICSNIYNFLSKHIAYIEESDKEQTTALPSAILTLKHGDCKHYSLFAAGILDALKREGKKIDWCYRFCSYKLLDKTPHHVFVVVKKSDGSELWIDAVPGADQLTPLWQLDKHVKNKTMPLYDVVGNTNVGALSGDTIGYTIAENIAHAAARVNPLLIAGRGAFLQMVKWNVRAWAKNMDYAITTKGRAFTDPLGKRWYLLGGRWDNLRSAIEEGKDKKMIGDTGNDVIGLTGAEIVALVAAAAPVIIAVTQIIKQAMGAPDWQEGQLLMPTTQYPTTPTSGGTDFLRNPLVLAGLAAGAFLLYKQQQTRKQKVNGMDENLLLLLLLGGGFILYKKSQQQQPPTDSLPEIVPDPVNNSQPVQYEVDSIAPIMDNAGLAPMVTEESAMPSYYGGGGGGSDPALLKEYSMNDFNDMQAMM